MIYALSNLVSSDVGSSELGYSGVGSSDSHYFQICARLKFTLFLMQAIVRRNAIFICAIFNNVCCFGCRFSQAYVVSYPGLQTYRLLNIPAL